MESSGASLSEACLGFANLSDADVLDGNLCGADPSLAALTGTETMVWEMMTECIHIMNLRMSKS